MSDRTSDNDDWVALLLAATESPRMPDDVAERLDRALREEAGSAAAPAGPEPVAAAPADLEPVGVAPADVPAPAEVGAAGGTSPSGTPTPAEDDAGTVPTADGAVVAGPWAGAVARPGSSAGSTGPDGSGDPRDGKTDETSGDLTADPDGDGPLPSVLAGASRPWGSSRRERREEHQGERRRNLLTRWAPVAAGVLVLGGAGITTAALLGGDDDGAAGGSDLSAASAAEEAAPAPRALVATGTEYATTDEDAFAEQVLGLVAVAGSGTGAAASAAADSPAGGSDSSADADSPADAQDDAEASTLAAPEEERSAVTDSPLTDRAAFDACVEEVTDGSATTVAAMDLAVVDGLESTVLVVPDAAGLSYLVYVVGPNCTGMDDGQFKFFTVTP